jgi:hypothetical protein
MTLGHSHGIAGLYHCPQKYGKKNDHLLLLHKSAQKVGHKLNPSSTWMVYGLRDNSYKYTKSS